jgi:hypothetical protein
MPRVIRLHESCWLAFLVGACLRATVFSSSRMAWPLLPGWLALIVAFFWACWQTRKDTAGARRWGWAYYPIAMNAAFLMLGPTIKKATAWRADDLLLRIDSYLIGTNLSQRLEPWISPALSELMSLGYMFFMLLLFGSILFYLFRSPHLERCYCGLFSVYGLGFLGYVVLPAAGPYVALADRFSTPIHGGWLTALNEQMVSTGSNHVDVFPSLHIAVSLFLWLTLLKEHRRVGKLLTPLMLVLWVSTIYLRYHYCIDLIVGAVLALSVFWLTAVNRRPAKALSDAPESADAQRASPCSTD